MYKVANPVTPKINPKIAKISEELQRIQRKRAILIKSRIMQANRLQAVIAGSILGYHSGLKEEERTKKFIEAGKLIRRVMDGEESCVFDGVIRATMAGIAALLHEQQKNEAEMLEIVKKLPIAKWVAHKDQAGFGLLSLATLIGETGDLANYANPGKVWRRMGCAPFESQGVTLMGATWRGHAKKYHKLADYEWEEFGYSPRRRSIAYVFGECLIKANGSGPYRRRYVEAKRNLYNLHPEYDWKDCDKCGGKGKINKEECGTCGGTGQKCLRAHLHGMLLATKLLLKNVWVEWNK